MKFKNIKKNKGFSIIELIAVIAIFGILTAVVVFNYADFNNNIIATNMSYEIALTIREAQVYSLGARVSGTNNFEAPYGAYFNINNLDHASRNFMLFSDHKLPSDGMCTGDDGGECDITACTDGECRELSSLTRSIQITELCVGDADPVVNEHGICPADAQSVKDLSITFQRPNPDAIIKTSTGVTGNNAAIIVEAPNAAKRAVIVRSTGQISVEVLSN